MQYKWGTETQKDKVTCLKTRGKFVMEQKLKPSFSEPSMSSAFASYCLSRECKKDQVGLCVHLFFCGTWLWNELRFMCYFHQCFCSLHSSYSTRNITDFLLPKKRTSWLMHLWALFQGEILYHLMVGKGGELNLTMSPLTPITSVKMLIVTSFGFCPTPDFRLRLFACF